MTTEERLAECGHQLDTLRAENERLRMEAIGHEDDCHESHKRADEACRQLAENGKQLATRDSTIAELRAEVERLTTALAACNRSLEEGDKQYAELREKVELLQPLAAERQLDDERN